MLSACATRGRVYSGYACSIGHNLMFCHQSPTSACATGNSGVRSRWNNVASSPQDGYQSVSRGDDCQPQGGRELGASGMVKLPETPQPSLNMTSVRGCYAWAKRQVVKFRSWTVP